MEFGDHTVPRLRELSKERGVKGYSRKRKAKLIANLGANKTSVQCPTPMARAQPTRPPPPLPSQSVGLGQINQGS